MKSVILGSSSRTRKMLLERLEVPFKTISPNIDETPYANEQPFQLASRLAAEKCEAVKLIDNTLPIITSDQVMYLDSNIIGKPKSKAHAISIIQSCSGKVVEFFTAIQIHCAQSLQTFATIEKPTVTYRHLVRDEIERYLARENTMDAAGAIHCEGLGISLLTSIQSNDPTALLGLPLIKVSEYLRQLGLQIP